ncbi:MAG: S-adenosylmethionine:tRNA ribosyltransferase-isomerase, partial [Dehalococcoidia bacterium]
MRFEMRAAHEPPEARGLRRDEVRLLVGTPDAVSHHRFTELPDLLEAGDVLVVNTSATLPAAIDVIGEELVLHASTRLDDGRWLVELRRADGPYLDASAGERHGLKGGAAMTLDEAYTGRLWVASFDVDAETHLRAYGRPIRYSYVDTDWPLDTYQTVFATHPGSAEMPSAGRPFTESVVTRLVNRGVVIAPLILHTGVASLE